MSLVDRDCTGCDNGDQLLAALLEDPELGVATCLSCGRSITAVPPTNDNGSGP